MNAASSLASRPRDEQDEIEDGDVIVCVALAGGRTALTYWHTLDAARSSYPCEEFFLARVRVERIDD